MNKMKWIIKKAMLGFNKFFLKPEIFEEDRYSTEEFKRTMIVLGLTSLLSFGLTYIPTGKIAGIFIASLVIPFIVFFGCFFYGVRLDEN